MPLPVQPAVIPTAPTTVAGLPAVVCDQVDPTIFAVTFAAGWARAGAAEGNVLFDLIFVSSSAIVGGEVAPLLDPADAATETSIALPISPVIEGQPQASDVPGAFRSITGWEQGSSEPGVVLPVPLPPELIPEGVEISEADDLWLRARLRTGSGQIVPFYYYFPAGLPEAFGQEVHFWIAADDQPFVEVVIPAADVPPGEIGPVETVELSDLVGSMPEPAKAIAVAPGCGRPFPVTFGAQPGAQLETGYEDQSGDGQLVIPAGYSSVTLRRRDAGATGDDFVRVGAYNLGNVEQGGNVLELAAPAGSLLPEISITLGGDGIVDWIGIAPPA